MTDPYRIPPDAAIERVYHDSAEIIDCEPLEGTDGFLDPLDGADEWP